MFEAVFNRLDARQQKLAVAGALALLAATLFTYALLPQIKLYRAAHESIAVLEAALEQGQDVGSQLRLLTAEVEGLERQLHGDMANLPEQQLEAFVIGRLQSVSWRNNVELVSIEPRAGEHVHMFSESLFRVALTGRYTDLYAWLVDTNAELGFIVIKEYEMRPLEDVAGDPLLTVGLTIASYRLNAS
jgi:hypothetical protein